MELIRSKSATDESAAITAIAIDRDKNSKYAVKWAVDHLLNRNSSHCILIHVRSQSLHPQDFDAAPKEGRPPTQAELQQLFLPYRGFCARKGIEAKEVVLHDIDVPSALVDYVTNNSIGNIVVGACSRNSFLRKFRDPDVPTSLLKSAPESCAVYVTSKGKVQTTRLASRPQTPTGNSAIPKQRSLRALLSHLAQDYPHSEKTSRASSLKSSDSSEMIVHDKLKSNGSISSPNFSAESLTSVSLKRNSPSDSSELSGPHSSQSTDQRSTENLEDSNTSESSLSSVSSPSPLEEAEIQDNIQVQQRSFESEMRRLRLELKQSMDLYNSVCRETVAAKEKERELQEWKAEEVRKLEKARLAEEAAFTLAEMERQKAKAAMEAAKMAQHLAETEIQKRKYAEMRATHEAEERKRAMERLAHNHIQYRRYTIDEIEAATNYFANSQKIGEGGYGPVYRAMLNHTAVAIKVLRPDLSQGQKQFQQEVEVLSSMRHPNMVLLIGACPEYGCLVYEYMENGSLEDRLFRKDNTPSIPWKTRFKVAAEIATALHFLHQAKPEPLVHRDLKPANILLDRNYVSKIADVGLARLVPPSVADSFTQYRLTAAAGTFYYIDPEYQQTGMLGVKSDLYSLGVMLLQMITAKPPVGISLQVEEAIENGSFSGILDPTVPDWPVEDALSLAKLALKCCELRKKDRPDLASVLLPELNRLRDLGMEDEASNIDKTVYVPHPYKSVPHIGTPHYQINVRRGWQYLKSMARMLSLKRTTSEKTCRKRVAKPNIKQYIGGCWSFVSCSMPYADLKRIESFS